MTRTPIVTRSGKKKSSALEDTVCEDKTTGGEDSVNGNATPVKASNQNSDQVSISEQKKNKKNKEAMKKMAAEYKVLKNQMSALKRKLVRVKAAMEADTDDPNQNLDCKQFLQQGRINRSAFMICEP